MTYTLTVFAKFQNLLTTPNSTTELETLHDITEPQEVIDKPVESAKKSEMNFNVDKCSVMHIGHNNIHGNCSMSNQLLPTTGLESSSPTITNKEML